MKAKRKPATEAQKREIRRAQGGLCFVWGCDQPIAIFEHWTPVAIGNDQPPDCGLCSQHAKEKTRRDMALIAKTKRIRNRRTQYDKRKAKGGTRIKSPGFRKDVKKKLTGEVVKR